MPCTEAYKEHIMYTFNVYWYRTLCNKCGLDLSDFTEDDLGLHDFRCGMGTHNDWILFNNVYHKSTSYYTTQNTTTYKCSVCGMTK